MQYNQAIQNPRAIRIRALVIAIFVEYKDKSSMLKIYLKIIQNLFNLKISYNRNL